MVLSKILLCKINPNYMIKYNINTAKKNGYLPISFENLKHLQNMLAKSQVDN